MPESSTSARSPTTGSGDTRHTLVTGGAGFIGSHLTEHLLARGDTVTVVDNLSTGSRANLPDAHERLRFIEADLSDALDAFGPGEVFDEIYHLAAAVGVRLIVEQRIRSIETNVEQTSALLRFAATRSRDGGGVPTLIASSSEVYGKSSEAPFDEEQDVLYGPTSVSRWSYACSKAIDEYLALAHHDERGLPVVVARLFNTVGPRQIGTYGMVVPNFVEAALRDEPLQVFGDGAQTRCFCHVIDVVEALTALLARPEARGRVFNVGSDQPISIADLAKKVIETTGSRSATQIVSYDEAYAPGFEDPKQREPDLTRVRELIGFNPAKSLEQIVRDVVADLEERAR